MNTTTQTEKNLIITSTNELVKITDILCNEYHVKRVYTAINFYDDVLKFHPCNISAEINIYQNDKGEDVGYLEHISVFLNHDKLKIEIRYDEYRKKYNIFTHTTNKYPNLSNDYIRRIEREKESPKNIGVLTAKKIQDWINYYEELDVIYSTKNAENSDKVSEFRAKLVGLPVTWYKDNKSGYMDKNGLSYQFTIHSDGYVEEKIRITADSNLETFLKLSK